MSARCGPRKNRGELPDWFKIENYRDAKGFSVLQWYQQLSIRIGVESNVTMAGLRDDNRVIENWEILKKHPINNIDKFDPLFLEGAFGYDIKNPVALNEKAAVYHATNADIKFIYEHLSKAAKDSTATSDQLVLDPFSVDPEIRKELCAKAFTPTAHPMVRVNIDLPIEILVRQFSDFIRHVRRHMNLVVDVPYSRSFDLKGWYNSGVLPYLDLGIWTQETGKTFSDAAFVKELADITEETPGNKITVTTRRHIEELFAPHETLRLLLAQGASEYLYFSDPADKMHVNFSN